MSRIAERIPTGADLGRAKRGFDLLLGTSALIPLIVCAALTWLAPAAAQPLVRTLAVIWAGSLLAFFAGVRRGLTFSEAGGGRMSELATMLAAFGLGVVSLVLVSPAIAALGLAGVGVLDAVAARRREAPAYFVLFRPPQMLAAVVTLLVVQVHRS
ncbi:DUF3429 domain-containing protein [Caulobacter sp. S45]|uniref:DUF3429 domain-containing protein n=1 Tax=Caulobacter sp. S45 TaxID=1641861 RepID=UPI001575D01E|nr:DUF3429 domain-containing protein [Caulobacter sp. S45]